MPEPIKYDLLKHYKKCIRDYPTARRCRGLDTTVYRWALAKTNSFVNGYFWDGFSGRRAVPLGGSHRRNKLWKELVTHGEMDCDVPYISPRGKLKHVKVKIKHSFKDARNIINAKVYTWLGPQAIEIGHWRAEIKRSKESRMVIEEQKIKYQRKKPSGPSQSPGGQGLRETRRLVPQQKFSNPLHNVIPNWLQRRIGTVATQRNTFRPKPASARVGSLQWMAQGLDTTSFKKSGVAQQEAIRQRTQQRLALSRNARVESKNFSKAGQLSSTMAGQPRLASYAQGSLSQGASVRPGSLQWMAQAGGLFRPRQTSLRPGQMLTHGSHSILAPHKFASFPASQSVLASRGSLQWMAKGLRG
ncbi:MAG: hypothetical protein JSV30_02925 [Candidatus Omnitrophota bacterium]|nr:MAG: hypothetical protein JSV30_02925 [Candidatus Omnitrophota bacterium]